MENFLAFLGWCIILAVAITFGYHLWVGAGFLMSVLYAFAAFLVSKAIVWFLATVTISGSRY